MASRVFTRRSRKSVKGDGMRREPIPVMNLAEGIVGWEGQDDPAMPLNLPQSKKWLLVGLLSAITLVTPFASSILSPGISSLMVEFGETDAIVGAMTVSIYLLGYVVGPMFLAPLSEIYGRRPVLTGANIFFCLWQIGCALAPNITTLIIFRFFTGVGGSGCLTLGGGLVGDIFRPEERGFAMGIWTIGPLFGTFWRCLDLSQAVAELADRQPRPYHWPLDRRFRSRDHRLAMGFLDRVDGRSHDIDHD